ncbi:MAG: acetyltransferase [Actinobacteria bacterium]|nr:acetyltransferase [Actinomycetota bacterium]
MKKILLFPFGGNSREILISIIEINKFKPTWKVIGFLDDDKKLWGKKFHNIPICPVTFLSNEYPRSYLLAIPGNPQTFNRRKNIIGKFKKKLSKLATIIDPSARLATDAIIGKNTVIMANVVISTGVKIGNHVVVLPNTVITHDTKVDDYCMIGANVTISGYCELADNCYIGSGTNIKERIKIGKGTLIGLGSNVINNIPDGSVAFGNPAKVYKKI